jgi:hypothetical protein
MFTGRRAITTLRDSFAQRGDGGEIQVPRDFYFSPVFSGKKNLKSLTGDLIGLQFSRSSTHEVADMSAAITTNGV